MIKLTGKNSLDCRVYEEVDTMLYDIIIIGAGVGGLTAAQNLSKKGLNVIILEARNRIGGRIHTDRSSGTPIDLGASWIHDLYHNPIAAAADQYGLKLIAHNSIFKCYGEHAIYYGSNDRIVKGDLGQLKNYIKHFLTTFSAQSLDADVATILTNFSTLNPLKNEQQVKCWLANLMSCWTGADLNKQSIFAWQGDDIDAHAYVVNGYDHLIQALAQHLTIVLQQEVVMVDYQNQYVTVVTRDQRVYQAKRAIITVPIGVLKNNYITFQPPLPVAKRNSILQIGSGLLNKIILRFPYCFWDKDALSLQILSKQQDAIQFYINYYALLKIPVLVAICGGSLAELIEALPEAECHEYALSPLREIYGNIYVSPTSANVTHWRHDRYSLGAYSYLVRGSSPDCFDKLGDSINQKLYFAGEATHNSMYGTVHGAFLSGLRVTEELNLIYQRE